MGKSRRVRIAAVGTAALLAAGGFLIVEASSAEAGGATRYVAVTGSDTLGELPNDCTVIATPCKTIGHAVDEANANDTVSVGAGTYDESLHIRESLTIVGAAATGAHKTTIDGDNDGDTSVWIDGVDADSVPSVTLQNLDISGNSDDDGVLADDANVVIKNVVASNNDSSGIEFQGTGSISVTDTTANGNGEAGVVIENQTEETTADAKPAITADGPTATLSNDTFSGNDNAGVGIGDGTATADHLTVDNNHQGGFVSEVGTVTVSTSTFDHNDGLGIAVLQGTLTLNSSTVSNTQRLVNGSAEALGAGVIGFVGADLTINDSTIYKNVGQGVLSGEATVHVNNSTVAGTLKGATEEGGTTLPNGALAAVAISEPTSVSSSMRANLAPGLRTITPNAQVVPPSTLIATGTLVADNATPNCAGTTTDHGYNLSDDAACSFSATGSKNSGVAKLGAFGSHGGPTNTLVPVKGSDAIDQIPPGKAGCFAAGTDQRGEPRLEGPKCDVGAVEVHQTPIVISPASLPGGTIGKSYSVTFTATGGLGAPYVFSLATGSHLPPGLSLSSTGVLGGTPTAAGTYTFTISVDDPTLKTYTLVIGGGTPPLADTGTAVESMVEWGGAALGLGVIMLLAAGYTGRRHRR